MTTTTPPLATPLVAPLATPLDRIAGFARDLVVQAGAGTGKTHALVTLYLHLVAGAHAARSAVAPPRIAVMTFTDKAAGELKERIRTRLGALVAHPDEVARLEPTLAAAAGALGVTLPDSDGWTQALLSLGAAPVGTFHSFASLLLRRHAARAGIDPDFTMPDDAEMQQLVAQSAERAILDALTAGDTAVEELVAQFGFHGAGRSVGLVELVGKLRGQRAEEGRSAAGIDGNYDELTMQRDFARARARLKAVTEEVRAFDLKPGSEGQRLTSELAERLPRLDFARPADIEVVLAVGKKLRGPSVGEWKRALADAGLAWQDAYHGQRAVPWVAALARLVDAVERNYRAHKRSAGSIDFADQLVMARDLLRDDPAVRMSVRARFDAVLVDEFQDTNPVQAELVELIGARQPDDERARLFVVGDRKQSIYEFRGADVAVFARAATELVRRGGDKELLTQSRRSSPAVLALCNALFARAMAAKGGDQHDWEVVYDPPSDDLLPLRADAPEWAGAELIRVQEGPSSVTRAREARAIARRMAQLRDDGRRLGDMAMLLRRFTHVTDYLDALRAAGLPYFVVRGRGFFAAQEVRDLAAAMTVLDDPDNLLALVAVLRSPIVGVSDETLARLSLVGQLRARVLFDRATLLPASLPQAERAGLLRFRAQFRELAITADRLGPAACAQAIVDGADLVPLLAATADGEQRVANLSRLIEKARAFQTAGGDLRAFANWLRRAAGPDGEAEAAQAQIADERDDVVRVMTVHQAKGLEFPIVFVPACGALDWVETAQIVYDSGAGLGLKLRDELRPAERAHTAASRRVSELRTRRTRAESLRVFYVAATRARDLVIFSGERAGKRCWRASLDELAADERTAPLLRIVDGDALPPAPLELAVAAAARQAAAEAATAGADPSAAAVGLRATGDYGGLVDPDTAFWALIQKDKLGEALSPGPFLQQYREKAADFAAEMDKFRFAMTPSAVYFNPTERCNLNCSYCYLPETLRQDGRHMPTDEVLSALEILKRYFLSTLPAGFKPQIIFHGAEPTLNWDALLAAFDRYGDDFRFGVQTNGTVLSDDQYDVLMQRGVAIGLSLDCAVDEIVTRTRKTWDGHSIYAKVVASMEKLRGYSNYSVICTVTRENMHQLVQTVEFFHQRGVTTCMLNPVRCTRQGARDIKPADEDISRHYLAALDRTEELYRETNRRLVVANFANILIAILAPQARRLMCDISPCGGGRSFFALSANGDVFPCSEFIGVSAFNGGNLFRDKIEAILKTPPFKLVTGRKVEDIDPCCRCAVRHFCGSPCPAEAHEMNGGMNRTGAFCELYEDQVRYAMRLIADNRQDAFLWEDWDRDTTTTFELKAV